MEAQEFDLKELCEAANVTERTVRYYIAEGLLPPPVGVKSQSRYTAVHLERLQLIQSLKEQDFSLRQIKTLLEGHAPENIKPLLDPSHFADQAAEFVNRQPTPPQPRLYSNPFNQPNQGDAPNSVGGIFQSLNQSPLNPTKLTTTKPAHPLQMGFTRSWPNEQLAALEKGLTDDTPTENAPSPELSHLWEKLAIAPGIELMLDKTIADQNRTSLANLAEAIKRKLGQ